jgi:AefR-like transcriptional repressor, C-terminal domain
MTSQGSLADRFSKLADPGLLNMDDPLLAAQQFKWLVLSIPFNRAMFYGDSDGFTPDELDRNADEAVRVFLAAHDQPEIQRPGKMTNRRFEPFSGSIMGGGMLAGRDAPTEPSAIGRPSRMTPLHNDQVAE